MDQDFPNILDTSTPSTCACASCRSACTHRPGWFMPGEAEIAAALKGMSLKDFFDKHLAVDWLEDCGDEDTFLLAPAIVGYEGELYPSDPRGACTFFKNGGCEIHEAKPLECRLAHHDTPGDHSREIHLSIGRRWVGHRQQIVDLLGEEPVAKPYDGMGSLFSLFGGF